MPSQTKISYGNADNRWIVPHNLYLAAKYGAHINIEICTTVTAVKYLFKYVYKGHDRATVQVGVQAANMNDGGIPGGAVLEERDKIKQYVDARYVSASESIWRVFGFQLHDEKPNVTRLQLHLPGHHQVSFQDNEPIEEVINRAAQERTSLTAFFNFNRNTPSEQPTAYIDFPKTHVYTKRRNAWTPRQRGYAVGRMFFVHPSGGELYFLRLLLNTVRGPTSFKDLRTIDGQVHPTFKAACVALDLLQDDEEWDNCL